MIYIRKLGVSNFGTELFKRREHLARLVGKDDIILCPVEDLDGNGPDLLRDLGVRILARRESRISNRRRSAFQLRHKGADGHDSGKLFRTFGGERPRAVTTRGVSG